MCMTYEKMAGIFLNNDLDSDTWNDFYNMYISGSIDEKDWDQFSSKFYTLCMDECQKNVIDFCTHEVFYTRDSKTGRFIPVNK